MQYKEIPHVPWSDIERIIAKIEVAEDTDCWLWTGDTSIGGYGKISLSNKEFYVHRVLFKAVRGQLSTGMTLDHLCRQRACIDPEHLEEVTLEVNVLRGSSWAGKNKRKTHCPNGHEYLPENLYNTSRAARQCKPCDLLAKKKKRALRERKK